MAQREQAAQGLPKIIFKRLLAGFLGLSLTQPLSAGPSQNLLPESPQNFRFQLERKMNCDLALTPIVESERKEQPFTKSWAQEAIGLPETYELLKGLELPQVPVGVVDANISGADLSPDGLAAGLMETIQKERSDWSPVAPRVPHGTDVANLMIANPYVSSGLKSLLVWFTFLTTGESDNFTESTYAVGAPRVVNMSMGHQLRFTQGEISFARGEFQQLLSRLSENLPQDVIFVKSAGNDYGLPLSLFGSSELDKAPHVGAVLPAFGRASNRLITVASIDATGFVSNFSSGGEDVTVAAPGGYPLHSGTLGSPTSFSGTSAAAPLVTGAISTMLALKPDLTLEDIKNLLQRTAIPIRGQLSHPGYGGYGSLNLYKLALMTQKMVASSFKGKAAEFDFDSESERLRQYHLEKALSSSPSLSCDNKRAAVRSLRRSFFFNPQDNFTRELLSAAYRSEGYRQQALAYGTQQEARKETPLMRDSLRKHVLYLAQTRSTQDFSREAMKLASSWQPDTFTLDKLMEWAELTDNVELYDTVLIRNDLAFEKEDIFHHASRARLSAAPLEHLIATEWEFVSQMPLQFAVSSLARKGSAEAMERLLPAYVASSLNPERVLENLRRHAVEAQNLEVATVLDTYLSEMAGAQ